MFGDRVSSCRLEALFSCSFSLISLGIFNPYHAVFSGKQGVVNQGLHFQSHLVGLFNEFCFLNLFTISFISCFSQESLPVYIYDTSSFTHFYDTLYITSFFIEIAL